MHTLTVLHSHYCWKSEPKQTDHVASSLLHLIFECVDTVMLDMHLCKLCTMLQFATAGQNAYNLQSAFLLYLLTENALTFHPQLVSHTPRQLLSPSMNQVPSTLRCMSVCLQSTYVHKLCTALLCYGTCRWACIMHPSCDRDTFVFHLRMSVLVIIVPCMYAHTDVLQHCVHSTSDWCEE